MAVINEFVVVLHLLGMAAIVGGWLVVRGERRLVPSMLWGARAQVVTGLLLMGLAELDDDDPPNHLKLGVKLGVALAVAACAEVANVKQRRLVAAPASGAGADATQVAARQSVGSLVDTAFWLAVLNVAVATLWRSYS